MGVEFVSPPGWEAFAPGELPAADWSPEAAWPPEPAGWVFYVNELWYKVDPPPGAWDPTSPRPEPASAAHLEGQGENRDLAAENGRGLGPVSKRARRRTLMISILCALALVAASSVMWLQSRHVSGEEFAALVEAGEIGGFDVSGLVPGPEGYAIMLDDSPSCQQRRALRDAELEESGIAENSDDRVFILLERWTSGSAAERAIELQAQCGGSTDRTRKHWSVGPARVLEVQGEWGVALVIRIENLVIEISPVVVIGEDSSEQGVIGDVEAVVEACIREYEAASL